MKLDQELEYLIQEDKQYRSRIINLIASENYPSKWVSNPNFSFLDTKYAEGYPGKRYYGGCKIIDRIEQLAIDRAKTLFESDYANVQPWSGSQANQAVFSSLLRPGDKILSLQLDHGGHLTHGSPYSQVGKLYNCSHYTLNSNGELDYDQILKIGRSFQPKLIIAGYTAFSGDIDWKKLREITDNLGNCFLHGDIAHTSGLIAAKKLSNPIKYVDVLTSTTHKTLRGPRGGLILSNRSNLFGKFQRAVFPGIQGGPSVQSIASKAACFYECQQQDFKLYAEQVITNAKALAQRFIDNDIDLVTKVKNHTVIISLKKHDITGDQLQEHLELIGISTNKNLIPNDQRSAATTSGLRLGTPAVTTLGFTATDMIKLADIITYAIKRPRTPLSKNLLQQLEALREKNFLALKLLWT